MPFFFPYKAEAFFLDDNGKPTEKFATCFGDTSEEAVEKCRAAAFDFFENHSEQEQRYTGGGYTIIPSENTMMREKDNSYGRGYYPLPARLSGLGRFMDGLKPTRLISHKVWPNDPTEGGDIHMLTIRDREVSIFVRDIESLIALGLIRIQSNDPGQMSFYFVDKKSVRPRNTHRQGR